LESAISQPSRWVASGDVTGGMASHTEAHYVLNVDEAAEGVKRVQGFGRHHLGVPADVARFSA